MRSRRRRTLEARAPQGELDGLIAPARRSAGEQGLFSPAVADPGDAQHHPHHLHQDRCGRRARSRPFVESSGRWSNRPASADWRPITKLWHGPALRERRKCLSFLACSAAAGPGAGGTALRREGRRSDHLHQASRGPGGRHAHAAEESLHAQVRPGLCANRADAQQLQQINQRGNNPGNSSQDRGGDRAIATAWRCACLRTPLPLDAPLAIDPACPVKR